MDKVCASGDERGRASESVRARERARERTSEKRAKMGQGARSSGCKKPCGRVPKVLRAGPTGEGCGPRGEILGSRFTHHPNDQLSDARTDARRGERSGDVVNCGANPPPRANERESESEKEKKIVRERADATNSLAVTPMCASNAAIVRSRLHQDARPQRGRPGRPCRDEKTATKTAGFSIE